LGQRAHYHSFPLIRHLPIAIHNMKIGTRTHRPLLQHPPCTHAQAHAPVPTCCCSCACAVHLASVSQSPRACRRPDADTMPIPNTSETTHPQEARAPTRKQLRERCAWRTEPSIRLAIHLSASRRAGHHPDSNQEAGAMPSPLRLERTAPGPGPLAGSAGRRASRARQRWPRRLSHGAPPSSRPF